MSSFPAASSKITFATRPRNLGSFTIGRVAELEFPAFDALEFFPAATTPMIYEARRVLPGRISDDGKIVMSFHSFVVKTDHFTIVIDTCCNKSRPGREQFNRSKYDYLQGLAALNVKPEQVTHVMCTHLHWDHVGWNTQEIDGQWLPTFPNAKYVMARREYDFWNAAYLRKPKSRDNPQLLSFEDSVLPIMRAEKAILVDDDFELDNGIWLE